MQFIALHPHSSNSLGAKGFNNSMTAAEQTVYQHDGITNASHKQIFDNNKNNDVDEMVDGDWTEPKVTYKDCLNTFIQSRKGGIHLVHNNFVYRSNMRRQGRDLNKIYWECIYNRSIKCRGRLKSVGDQLFVTNGNS